MRPRRSSGQTLALLLCLAEQPLEWRHGYELSKATALKSGTLYPILIRLADRGLLETQWQPAREPGRPPRHVYRLTRRGAEFVAQELALRKPRGRFVARASRA